jgi:integrase
VEQLNFTKAAIEALPLPPEGKRRYYRDGGTTKSVRGLEVCVLANGKRSFYLCRWAHGKSQRVRLGSYPEMTVEQARRKAMEENAAIEAGHDPSVDRAKKRAEWTFKELFDWYLEYHAKQRKRSWGRDKANFENHLSEIAPLPVSKVTKPLIRQTHAKIGQKAGPYAANRVLALVSAIFSKAIAHDHFGGANPAHGVEAFPEQSRDRRLTAAEVPRLLAAITEEPNETLRDFILMLLFTGARRSNVLAMRWDEIDFDAATWRIPLTKSGRPQFVPLENAELSILRRRKANGSPWVFPGRSDNTTGHLTRPEHGWERILNRAEIENLRLHDLRRTLGSWMVDTGASLPVIGQALHHQSQATTAIYARLSLDPVRQAKRAAHEAMLRPAAKEE